MANLREYRNRHLGFPERLEQARNQVGTAKAELDQAEINLKQAEQLAAGDALTDAKPEDVSNEAKRKAVQAKAVAGCPVCQVARDDIHKKTLALAKAEAGFELVRDQRRAVEHSQAAALGVIQAFGLDL